MCNSRIAGNFAQNEGICFCVEIPFRQWYNGKKQKEKPMKYLSQFLIIISFSLMGEVLQRLIPVPIPASVYGIALLFAALCLGVVKLEQIKEEGKTFPVECQFCDTVYRFTPEDIEELLKNI